MNVSKYLPRPNGRSIVVVNRQTVEDISGLMKRGVKDSKEQAESIAWMFRGRSKRDTCGNIWNYLKKNVRYEKESPEVQSVKTLSRLLVTDKKGDCKHLATAAAALCKALNIRCHFRLVSFDYSNPTPTHVYTVAYDDHGSPIYIDAVIKRFDEEPAYKHKTDVKC